jgi:putative YhbY family RNA-binding protein
MAAIELTPKQRQEMKARAHGLKPVVLLGAAGLNPPTLREIDRALAAHELIKVRVPGDDRVERERICGEIAAALEAVRVQQIGKLLVLFRPAPVDAPADQSAPRPNAKQAARHGTSSAATASARPGTKLERREIEEVNRVPAPRRDPGKAKRAAGKLNAPRKAGRTR